MSDSSPTAAELEAAQARDAMLLTKWWALRIAAADVLWGPSSHATREQKVAALRGAAKEVTALLSPGALSSPEPEPEPEGPE